MTDEEKRAIDKAYEEFNAKSQILESFVFLYYEYVNNFHNYGTPGNVHRLSMLEMHTLTMIEINPGITVTELAEKWNKSVSALSQTVARLEQYEYIYKERNADNPRIINIYVTPKGEILSYNHKKFDITNAQRKRNALADIITPEKVEEFYKTMEIYSEILKKDY